MNKKHYIIIGSIVVIAIIGIVLYKYVGKKADTGSAANLTGTKKPEPKRQAPKAAPDAASDFQIVNSDTEPAAPVSAPNPEMGEVLENVSDELPNFEFNIAEN